MSEGFLDTVVAGSFGGLVVGLIIFFFQWYKETRTESRRRHVGYLQNQLHDLYGPLHFFLSQNEQLVKHSVEIDRQYKDYFEGKQWADEAMKRIEEQALATIHLSNRYSEKVTENNTAMVDILQTQWYLIDEDDIELFSSFQTHVIRHHIEFAENQAKGVPLSIRLKLGNVRFYDPESATRVRQKWNAKRDELRTFRTGFVGRRMRSRPTTTTER